MADATDQAATGLQSNSLQGYIDIIHADNDTHQHDGHSEEDDGSLISVGLVEPRKAADEDDEDDEEDFSVWSIISSSAINLVLPFINGLMLGFGEIVAHEIGFRYGWYGAKVEPRERMLAHRRKIELARSIEDSDTRDSGRNISESSKWL